MSNKKNYWVNANDDLSKIEYFEDNEDNLSRLKDCDILIVNDLKNMLHSLVYMGIEDEGIEKECIYSWDCEQEKWAELAYLQAKIILDNCPCEKTTKNNFVVRNRGESIGIVRALDDLGRIVIPKEIRRAMNLKEGSPLEIITYENEIVLKPYVDKNKEQSLVNWRNLVDNELSDKAKLLYELLLDEISKEN